MAPLSSPSKLLGSTSSVQMSPSQDQFSRHLFLLHSAIRLSTDRVLRAVHNITVLSPDASLDDLGRRLHHVANIVLEHCVIEDQTILPRIRRASAHAPRLVHTTELTSRKRPRTPTPFYFDNYNHSNEHQKLRDAIHDVQDAFSRLRDSPFLAKHHSPIPDSPLSTPTSPNPDSNLRFLRQHLISDVKKRADNLSRVLSAHFDAEEEHIVPMFLHYLTRTEQAELIVQATHATVSGPYLPHAYRYIAEDDLVTLFRVLSQHCEPKQFDRIAVAVAHVLSVDRWRLLCGRVPRLSNMVLPNRNSLIEITHIHKALEKELKGLIDYSQNLDMSNPKHVQSLKTRFRFLRRVHSYHAQGEERVLLKELNAKIHSSDLVGIHSVCGLFAEHEEEDLRFEEFFEKLDNVESRLASIHPSDHAALRQLNNEFVGYVRVIADHLIEHMQEEEKNALPLIRKLFSLEDQERMMRRVMAIVPTTFLSELIPWMFDSLELDDQESMLRNVIRTAPQAELDSVIASIVQSVQRGMTERSQWNEICLRVPELEENSKFKSLVDKNEHDDNGPVSEIIRVHKAFRIELNALMRRCNDLSADGTIPDPNTLSSLAQGASFLRRMVADHSKAEDEILLPRLEEKSPGMSAKYEEDHCDERRLFSDLAQCLEDLRCAGEEAECRRLVKKLQVLSRTLRDEMVHHLDLEEKHMWPAITALFTHEEQTEIVALVFGHMSCNLLREILPWMIRTLSVSESNTMMSHILQVTKSTMFESWLKTWLPLSNDSSSDDSGRHNPEDVENKVPERNKSTSTSTSKGETNTAMMYLCGRDNIERAIRSIARDSALTAEERTRMMQRVMLAPYGQTNSKGINRRHRPDNRKPTYVKDKNGVKRLGCRHYFRACKVRAECCGELHTCRLCHDAEHTHVMDRSKVTEILCMRCDTLQCVSERCVNVECGQRFARYFCAVCVFYDDKEGRSVYHCHSCNVCRVGKGLGIDFFHCMKCNQCMNIKYQKGHNCVEKAMESDCPICRQYLFTSTSPVKYLRCGHIMHRSCYDEYSKENSCCPVCSKSLEETTALYQYLDKQLQTGGGMPREYRSARCDLFCLDCQGTNLNVPYHFLFNRCPDCGSYNTRAENIDANAGETQLMS